VDPNDGWLGEGWIHLDSAELSPQSLQKAKGDFSMFALHAGGALVASGRGGGYRPIYVARPSENVVLACTRLSPLLALLPAQPALDLRYLAASLVGYGPRPRESTPYAGIEQVPLGEAWLVRPAAQRQRWSMVAPLLDAELRDDGELALRLRHAITEATRRAAGNAARVGVLVSGGLDSSMILSLLDSLARSGEISTRPEAIAYESVAPVWHDDQPHLRSLETDLHLHAHRIAPRDAAPFIGRTLVVDAMPAPVPTLCIANATGAIARAHDIDLVLTGAGGDHVLDGDPRLFGGLARKGQLFRAFDGALRTRGVFYHGRIGRLARFIARPLLEPMLPRSGVQILHRLRRHAPVWAGPAFARHLGACAPPTQPVPRLEESPDERYARLLHRLTVSPWSLARLQEEAIGGYTLRWPLLDDDFLRFAATLPPLSLMQGGRLRGLMRDAMRGLVPESLRLRETKGTFHWFIDQALEMAGGLEVLASLADVRMLADLRLVEPKPFRALFTAFRDTADDNATYADLWCVLSAEAFLRQYASQSSERLA
jgi:asparagine synthase (glutamine-hydrolysing)